MADLASPGDKAATPFASTDPGVRTIPQAPKDALVLISALYRQGNRHCVAIAKDFGIATSLIHKGKRQDNTAIQQAPTAAPSPLSTDEVQERQRLHREVIQLRMDRGT